MLNAAELKIIFESRYNRSEDKSLRGKLWVKLSCKQKDCCSVLLHDR